MTGLGSSGRVAPVCRDDSMGSRVRRRQGRIRGDRRALGGTRQGSPDGNPRFDSDRTRRTTHESRSQSVPRAGTTTLMLALLLWGGLVSEAVAADSLFSFLKGDRRRHCRHWRARPHLSGAPRIHHDRRSRVSRKGEVGPSDQPDLAGRISDRRAGARAAGAAELTGQLRDLQLLVERQTPARTCIMEPTRPGTGSPEPHEGGRRPSWKARIARRRSRLNSGPDVTTRSWR